jgi:hypothetical protein
MFHLEPGSGEPVDRSLGGVMGSEHGNNRTGDFHGALTQKRCCHNARI